MRILLSFFSLLKCQCFGLFFHGNKAQAGQAQQVLLRKKRSGYGRTGIAFLASILIFLCAQNVFADSQVMSEQLVREKGIHVDLFLSSTCPHCHQADIFFQTLEKKYPWLQVRRYTINTNKADLTVFSEKIKQGNINSFAVPAIFFCGSHWVGFDTADTTGKILQKALLYCHEQRGATGQLSQSAANLLIQWGAASQIHVITSLKESVFKVVSLMGLADAISNCSLFSLMLLLGFLWLYPLRSSLQLKLGLAFIFALGLIHYLQLAYPLAYQEITAGLRLPTATVGILLVVYLFFYRMHYYSYSAITDEKKLFKQLAVPLVIASVWSVQIYQQTCTLNFAVVFEQWIATQSMTVSATHFYQLQYIIFYLLPFALVLLLLIAFGKIKRYSLHAKRLNILARILLITTSFCLIVIPTVLAQFWLSLWLLVGTLFLTFFLPPLKNDPLS